MYFCHLWLIDENLFGLWFRIQSRAISLLSFMISNQQGLISYYFVGFRLFHLVHCSFGHDTGQIQSELKYCRIWEFCLMFLIIYLLFNSIDCRSEKIFLELRVIFTDFKVLFTGLRVPMSRSAEYICRSEVFICWFEEYSCRFRGFWVQINEAYVQICSLLSHIFKIWRLDLLGTPPSD